jgi:hypothetical protein
LWRPPSSVWRPWWAATPVRSCCPSSLNKSAGGTLVSGIFGILLCPSSRCRGDGGRRQAGWWKEHRGRAHQWRSAWRCLGACVCSRRSAVAALLPLLLAERRPFNYLPVRTPKGRHCSFGSVAMVVDHGSFVVKPSGLVPGDGEEYSDEKLRTRSRFFTSVWGPFCKVQGLACNFKSSVCPDVMCSVHCA